MNRIRLGGRQHAPHSAGPVLSGRLGAVAAPARSSDAPAVAEPAVVCPAIEQDGARRTNYPGEPERPIGLVVLGKCKTITPPSAGDGVFEVQVEKVLYGSIPGKTVRFTHPWAVEEDKPLIVALVPAVYNDQYEFKYVLDGSEAKSQEALSAARLDFNVLSSASIFIGKELSAGGNYIHRVEAVRGLYGPELKKGQKVLVYMGGYIRGMGERPTVRGEEMVYLVSGTAPARKVAEVPPDEADETAYVLDTRLPADQEPAVLEALKRRDAYPVIEVGEEKVKCREVLFRGTTAEAIELMGSRSAAAITLGARRLMYDKDAARQDILAAIEKDLLAANSTDPTAFQRLRSLIELVGVIDKGKTGGDLGRLTEKVIAYITSNPPEPPALPKRPFGYWSSEEEAVDVNHALAWLLMAMPEADAVHVYGKRVLALRDAAKGRWKDEVQLALDAAKVEDMLDLEAALARMKDSKPARIAPAVPASGEMLAFSHDGRYLAAGQSPGEGVVWKVDDWSRAGTFEAKGSVEALVFSNDDQSLYVLGGAMAPIHDRVDWRTGKREDVLGEHKQGITQVSLSADGTRMLTASYYENKAYVWEMPAGKMLKSFGFPEECHLAALSPDGKTLVRQTAKTELAVEPLDGGPARKISESAAEISETAFAGDSKHLIVCTYGYRDSFLLKQYDISGAAKVVATGGLASNRCTGLLVCRDARHVVALTQDGKVAVFSLPDLALVKVLVDEKYSSRGRASVALSPDGKRLAIGSRSDTVRLFDAATFEPILPASGHGSGIKEAYFSADGKTIRTIGTDNSICTWDAATLKMTGREPCRRVTRCSRPGAMASTWPATRRRAWSGRSFITAIRPIRRESLTPTQARWSRDWPCRWGDSGPAFTGSTTARQWWPRGPASAFSTTWKGRSSRKPSSTGRSWAMAWATSRKTARASMSLQAAAQRAGSRRAPSISVRARRRKVARPTCRDSLATRAGWCPAASTSTWAARTFTSSTGGR